MGVKIYSRASWGARYRAGFGSRSVGRLRVFKHHTVMTHLSKNASVAEEKAEMRRIEAVGQARFGGGISYTFIIFPSGRIYEGTGIGRIGAHTGGYNTVGAAICWAGNYDTHPATNEQYAATVALLAHGRGRWWPNTSFKYTPHSSMKATACPGKNSRNLMNKEKAAALRGDVPSRGGDDREPELNLLTVDGKWGRKLTLSRQKRTNSKYKDGEVSRQNAYWEDMNPGCTNGWEWKFSGYRRGSAYIKKEQKRLKRKGYYKGKKDGLAGPMFFEAVQLELRDQGWYKGQIDGKISYPSLTVKGLQRRENKARKRDFRKKNG